LARSVQELGTQVGKLADVIGFGLEDVARVVVPGWLYRHESVNLDELTRKFVVSDGEEVEVNLYGEGVKDGAKVFVVGEAKSGIYKNDVEKFDENADKFIRTLGLIQQCTDPCSASSYIHPLRRLLRRRVLD